MRSSVGERVRHGGAHRCGEDLAAFGSEDLVEGVDELASAVAHERAGVGELVAVTEQQVPRRLGGPDAGGVVSDPCEVHGPGGDVDEEQQVEPAQRDGFDGGEVAGDGGLGPQRPGDFRACGCGVDSGVVEDLPDRGCSEAVAEPGEFAVDAAVSPGRILGCPVRVGESAEVGRAACLWVPIIRSWALTRGFGMGMRLHPGVPKIWSCALTRHDAPTSWGPMCRILYRLRVVGPLGCALGTFEGP